MNDWTIKRFLMAFIIIQLAVWSSIGLDALNLHIPLVRQLICFVYLTFIPGIIILRILRLHNLGSIKTVLYSVGLSLATLMLIGLLINLIYPTIGIKNPFSPTPLISTITIFIFLLIGLCYVRDERYVDLNPSHPINNPIIPLILCLIPFLSIFGTYSMNLYENSTLTMILLLIIGLMPIFILKWIPEKFYPLTVFIISISLLLHTSLISSYIWGADINTEYIYSNLVLVNSHWNWTITNDVNAMLSIVMIAPIYSVFLNLNLVWLLKIVYPTLFALVPLGLFIIFKKVTNDKIAFLACFFFMATSVFYNVMPALGRQELAELFIVLLIMLVLDTKINRISRSILSLIFAMCLIVSHYGTTYIFMIIVVLAAIIPFLNINITQFRNYKFNIPKIDFNHYKIKISNFKLKNYDNNLIVGSFLIFFVVLSIAWYVFVSGSSIFIGGVSIGSNILNSITDLMNPNTSQGAYLFQLNLPLFQSIEKYLNIIAQIFIGIGIILLIFSKNRFNREYKFLAISSFIIATAGIILPIFASTLNSDRLYTISLLFLAPFFVIGFLKFLEILNRVIIRVTKGKKSIDHGNFLQVISIFLVIFFFFSSAFVYQIFDTQKQGSFALDSNTDFYNLKDSEILSIKWITNRADTNLKIYTDLYHVNTINSIKGSNGTMEVLNFTIPDAKTNYLVLGRHNIKYNKMYIRETNNLIRYQPITELKINMSKIYDNGESQVLVGKEGGL